MDIRRISPLLYDEGFTSRQANIRPASLIHSTGGFFQMRIPRRRGAGTDFRG